MRKSENIASCRRIGIAVFVLVLAAAFCIGFGGIAMAASGSDGGDTHAAAEEHGDAGHGEVHSKGWVRTDTYRVMNFAVLFIGLLLILRKPVSEAFSERIKAIKVELEDLEVKKKEAESQLAQYNQQLAKLDQESEKIVEDYIRQGHEAKARILKEAESAAEKLEEQARRSIDNEFKKAKQQLQDEVIEKALVKAEEIVKNNITTDDQNRLVDDYLKKVVA